MRRLVILACIWGWSFLFIKVAVEGMTPATVAWARVTLGAGVMLVVLAVTYNTVPFTLLAWGEQHLHATLAAGGQLIAATAILLPFAAAGVVFLDEAFESGLVLGGALTIVGIAMLHGRLSRPRAHVVVVEH